MNFPKLKDIIGIDIKDVLNKFHFIHIDRSIKNIVEVKEGGILAINYDKLRPEDQKEFNKLIRVKAIPADQVIIEQKAQQKTLGIKTNLPTTSDEKLLEFYKTKLSQEYIDALEIALIIKNKKESDQQGVRELKRDVSHKYPIFGNNLCNLVSEGYFNTHFKELYENMAIEEDFTLDKYTRKIEQIVISLPYTIFVNAHQTNEELSGLIIYKLSKLKEYGSHRLLVHALNRDNVEKAQIVIIELESSYNVKTEYDPKKINYMTAILRLDVE